jgi:hypothetical protein
MKDSLHEAGYEVTVLSPAGKGLSRDTRSSAASASTDTPYPRKETALSDTPESGGLAAKQDSLFVRQVCSNLPDAVGRAARSGFV